MFIGNMLLIYTNVSISRARIQTLDGHLKLMVAEDRNITFYTGKNGAILFNGQDMESHFQLVCYF